jgi:LacI family transcriptional regulator
MNLQNSPVVTDYSRRLAVLLRTLLDCGYFGPTLPPVQTMVVKMRMPKTAIEDALTVLQDAGHLENRAGHYHRVYPPSRPVRPRIGVFSGRNLFAPYFEVYQDYFIGLAEMVEQAGYDLLLSHDLASPEGQAITLDEFVRGGVTGIAVLGRLEPEIRAALAAKRLPTVLCGNATIEQREFGCVCSDNFVGMKDLVRHLVAQGHRAIGYYTTSAQSHDGYRHRLVGYREAMEEAGLPPRREMVLDAPHAASSANTAAQVFAGLRQRPTALICACDRDAFELISELQKSGLRVPHDVSVVGFENSFFNSLAEPALTTVDIYPREMGRVAGGFLLNELKHPQLPVRIVLPAHLIERGSVRARPADAPLPEVFSTDGHAGSRLVPVI